MNQSSPSPQQGPSSSLQNCGPRDREPGQVALSGQTLRQPDWKPLFWFPPISKSRSRHDLRPTSLASPAPRRGQSPLHRNRIQVWLGLRQSSAGLCTPEGSKTMGYEIAEQLGWHTPKPGGSHGWRQLGQQAAQAFGRAGKTRPGRRLSVQDLRRPGHRLTNAVKTGLENHRPACKPNTIAGSLAIGDRPTGLRFRIMNTGAAGVERHRCRDHRRHEIAGHHRRHLRQKRPAASP